MPVAWSTRLHFAKSVFTPTVNVSFANSVRRSSSARIRSRDDPCRALQAHVIIGSGVGAKSRWRRDTTPSDERDFIPSILVSARSLARCLAMVHSADEVLHAAQSIRCGRSRALNQLAHPRSKDT